MKITREACISFLWVSQYHITNRFKLQTMVLYLFMTHFQISKITFQLQFSALIDCRYKNELID